MPSSASPCRWISAANAARLLGISPRNIPRLADEGYLAVRRLPGCDPRFSLNDAKQLAASSTSAATLGPNSAATSPAPPASGLDGHADRTPTTEHTEGGRR
jgi:hypothetical protein